MSPEAFIRAHTAVARPPLVPEVALHLASEITPIWQATEAFLDQHGLSPPYWAFAWPGSQALARQLLDGPPLDGLRVLDFGAGSGLAAIAATMRGARAECAEVDQVALAACRLNAALNGVAVEASEGDEGDVVGEDCHWDLILAGDVCYEAPMVAHILPWLRRMAAAGAEVRLADPGRAYLPREGLAPLAEYRVPTSLELEDRAERRVAITRLLP